jgi:hypothetical protein
MTFEVQRPWHCLHSNHLVLTDTPTQLSQPAYKGRPLSIPTKTILTTLLSQIRRPSSPNSIQRSTPIRTDQNVLTVLLSWICLSPYKSRPPTFTDQNQKPFQPSFFTDTGSLLSSSPCKGRTTRYRPKPSCSNRCAQQLSQCPCKGRSQDVPTKTK